MLVTPRVSLTITSNTNQLIIQQKDKKKEKKTNKKKYVILPVNSPPGQRSVTRQGVTCRLDLGVEDMVTAATATPEVKVSFSGHYMPWTLCACVNVSHPQCDSDITPSATEEQ